MIQSDFLLGATRYFFEELMGKRRLERAVSTRLIILLGDMVYFCGVSKSLSSCTRFFVLMSSLKSRSRSYMTLRSLPKYFYFF